MDERHHDGDGFRRTGARDHASTDAIHTVMYGEIDAGAPPVNTLVYGPISEPDMTDQLSADDWIKPGPEGARQERLHGAEGRSAGKGHGRLARQLLLAFCRSRRVPRGRAEALARDRGRADHRRCRGRQRRAAEGAAAQDLWRPARSGARGAQLGGVRSGGASGGPRHRPPPARLYRGPAATTRARPRRSRRRARRSCTGRFSASRSRARQLSAARLQGLLDEILRMVSA